MPSIAIIGAGPQLGLAIARTFGAQGYDVALIARNRAKLDSLVGQLASDGITAAAFPADVLDHPALTQAIGDAAARFGGIDVLEDVQEQIESQLYGAIAAAYWELHNKREDAEHIFTVDDPQPVR